MFRSVPDAGCTLPVDRHEKLPCGSERFDLGEVAGRFGGDLRVRQAETAFVLLRGYRRRTSITVGIGGRGLANHRPRRARRAIAHRCRVNERLQEVQGDRQQRCSKGHATP